MLKSENIGESIKLEKKLKKWIKLTKQEKIQ